MGEFLRGDYQGNHSAFIVPCASASTTGSEASSHTSNRGLDAPLSSLPSATRQAVGSGRF